VLFLRFLSWSEKLLVAVIAGAISVFPSSLIEVVPGVIGLMVGLLPLSFVVFTKQKQKKEKEESNKPI
ncbi:hypothetical protein ACFLS1_10530, partial [Verrucomicrobiota bacterium]